MNEASQIRVTQCEMQCGDTKFLIKYPSYLFWRIEIMRYLVSRVTVKNLPDRASELFDGFDPLLLYFTSHITLSEPIMFCRWNQSQDLKFE